MSETFADRLRIAREKAGLSQVQLAEMVGISDRQISRYERGESAPRGDTLEKIAQALQISSKHLLQSNSLIILSKTQLGKYDVFPMSYFKEGLEDMLILELRGAQLEPWYFDTELLLINTKDIFIKNQLPKFSLFLFKFAGGDDYSLRILRKNSEGLIAAWCPNPEYPPAVFSGKDVDDIQILGRVVGSFEG